MVSKQREISIAEFFEKNKHILGYSNPAKSLITCVREAIDNSLDACEEAGILPDILVRITKLERSFKVVVEDNGPGIIKEEISKVFGKLLYGSRFHAIKQSRGQQGIGISSAVLYAQITTGKPAVVTSKTENGKAWRVKLYINTKKNEPEIVEEEEIEWYVPHGTRIELEVVGSYVKEKRQSVYEYLRQTSIVNPHAKITFIEPDGQIHEFPRVSNVLPPTPKEIKPHPHGIELGRLLTMLKQTKTKDLLGFLKNEFVRIGDRIGREIIKKANLDEREDPRSLDREKAVKLLDAFKVTDLLPPPTDCLSPIGEELIKKSLITEFKPEFVYAVTRKPKVYSGHPFLVEVGLAYGGEIKEEKARLLRFANKIPLLYQQGGCALTKAVEGVNWRNYGLQQSKGELPQAPIIILVHLASTNIPYISESKEAVSGIPEIIEEIKLALQEAGRKLREHIERKSRLHKKRKKEEALFKVIPLLAKKISEVLERDELNPDRIIAKIVGSVFVERIIYEDNKIKKGKIFVANYTRGVKNFKIYEMCDGKLKSEKVVGNSAIWEVRLKPMEEIVLEYEFDGEIINKKPIIEGLDEDELIGGEVMLL